MSAGFKVILLASAMSSALFTLCHADDPRCSAPPYGGTVQEFKSFVKYFGEYMTPAKFMGGLCNMKFGGTDRTSLYNLGFTDRDIDSKPSGDLWVDVLTAIREVAKRTN